MAGPEKSKSQEGEPLSKLQRIRKQLKENPKVFYAGELKPLVERKVPELSFGNYELEPPVYDIKITHNLVISPQKPIVTPEGLNKFKRHLLSEIPASSKDLKYHIDVLGDGDITVSKDIEAEGCLIFEEIAQKGKLKILEETGITLYPDPNFAQFIFDKHEAIRIGKVPKEDTDGLFLLDIGEAVKAGLMPMPQRAFYTFIDLRDRIPEHMLKMIKKGNFQYLQWKKEQGL